MKYLKEMALLAFIATVFPELATGSTQFTVFFGFLGPFLLVAYGFAVLLIREAYVRWKLGILGLFLLGFGYGILNEGVLNDTLLRNVNVPNMAFDGYGYYLGINFPWVLHIGIFHAIFSVMIPILFVHMLCRKSSTEQWLSGKGMVLLAIPLAAEIIALWKMPYSIIFLVSIGVLALIAKSLREKPMKVEKTRVNRAAIGVLFYTALIFGGSALAGVKVNELVFFAANILMLLVTYRYLKNMNDVVAFGIGGYFAISLFMFVFLFSTSTMNAAIGLVIIWVLSAAAMLNIRKT